MMAQLQDQCELGQEELSRTNYVEAERILADAESQAWRLRDFDTLARLYMPLQEARRQRRQRCGEGDVCLDLWAESENDHIDGRHVVENYPTGQLLVAGWGSIEPARTVRRLQRELGLYVETFLGAVYPTDQDRVIIVVPLETDALPPVSTTRLDDLTPLLPRNSIIFRADDLPQGIRAGGSQTYAEVMAIWERLHAPFLSAAQQQTDPIRRIEAYRRAIEVDYACELAHQELSDLVRNLARSASPVNGSHHHG